MNDVVPDGLRQIFEAQKQAFEVNINPDVAYRRERLRRLSRLLKTHAYDLCAAVSKDFGHRSYHETMLLEIVPLMGALRHSIRHLRGWMAPTRRPSTIEFLQLSNWIHYQPLGVVGIMAPWNYPLLLALGPLIDTLAAGNRAMIKPSESVPDTSALLRRLIAEYFDPNEVNVIEGGIETASLFASLPFDHLLFTGSTEVGRKVMAAAAPNLTPVTLELGGKSPAIIAPDYPVAKAARDIAFGKLMNAGQTCIAPDYVLVERSQLDAFVKAFVTVVEGFYPEATAADQVTDLISLRGRERLVQALDECKQRGVKTTSVEVAVKRACAMPPTVVIEPPADCILMREEIFGPVLPVLTYTAVDEALAFVRARARPLALYVFSNNRAEQRSILSKTHSGNVTINGTLLHITQNSLPFGGVGASGMGAYHGRDGFIRFSHARGITKVRLFNPTRLASPPYGRLASLLVRILGRA